MQILTAVVVDAITYASWLFVVSLGLTLVFGVLKVLNVAHGSVYALGAYCAASAVALAAAYQLPPTFALVAMLVSALALSVAIGPPIERLLLARLYGRDEVSLLLATYALFLIIEDVAKLVWGVNPYFVAGPAELFGGVPFAGMQLAGYDLFLVALAVVCGLATWYGLNRTRAGKVVLAVIHNPEMSASMGVDVRRIQCVAFSIGLFLAALGGAFTAPMISVQPGISVSVIVISFAVVIIGGLGSIPGAALGALIVGLARSLSVHFMPQIELFSVYLVMAAVLAFRPEGLFRVVKARLI